MDQIELVVLVHHLPSELFLASFYIAVVLFGEALVGLHLFGSDFVVKKATDIVYITVSVLEMSEMRLSLLQSAFELSYAHLERHDLIVLVLEDNLYCGHIDIGLFVVCWQFMQVPCLKLPFHASVFLHHVPYVGF